MPMPCLQTTMRSELGKITLDKTFEEREALNLSIVRTINEAADAWGLTCLRCAAAPLALHPSRVLVHVHCALSSLDTL